MPKEKIFYSDFLIIGGGIAGLSSALETSKHGSVILLTKGKTGETATEYAQGGIAAAVDEEKDSPIYHFEDTLEAGAGLCDEEAVKVLVTDGIVRVKELIGIGATFDRAGKRLDLTIEGAHKHRRILHTGDATGAEIERAIAAKILKEKLVDVRNFVYGKDLIINNGVCLGAHAHKKDGSEEYEFLSPVVILATGGLCQVFSLNSNPSFATGDGVAMAYRAGAEVQDMEFVQFHPTVLARPERKGRRLLISESLRGEGAILINSAGEQFMKKYHEMADLAPRDIVSRAIVEEMRKTGSDHVFLSLEKLEKEKIKGRFPTIYEGCLEYGIDITKDKIPVSPAAHYAMGGVKIDLSGRTNIPGLFAAGEVSSAGVHGANRLASNSLLDGLVFGHRAGNAAVKYLSEFKGKRPDFPSKFKREKAKTVKGKLGKKDVEKMKSSLRKLMWKDVGIIRNGNELNIALEEIGKLEEKLNFTPRHDAEIELKNMALVSKLITKAALERTESRGAHFRTDYSKQENGWKKHLIYQAG
jgi:L-aspartate oxidase